MKKNKTKFYEPKKKGFNLLTGWFDPIYPEHKKNNKLIDTIHIDRVIKNGRSLNK